jgi:hypothetical protein
MQSISQNSQSSKRPLLVKEIYELLGNAVLLPLRAGKKFPGTKSWQNTTWEQTQNPEYQTKLRGSRNIGVLLGERSGGLVAIDIDKSEELEPFLELNPGLKTSLRTLGSKGAQIWVRLNGNDYPRKKITFKVDPDSREHVAEFRTNGCQSVIRGIHPDTKKPYQCLVEAPPVQLDYSQIVWPPHWISTDSPKKPAEASSDHAEGSLRSKVRASMRPLCLYYYPNGTDEGNEYRLGSPSGEPGTSFCICLEGEKSGVCIDHDGGRGMFFTEALAQKLGVSMAEAEAELERYFGRRLAEKWRDGLELAALAGQIFRELKITPRKRILDVWFREGDAGFVYSARGVGKTMLGFGMAKAISKGQRFGPWAGGDASFTVVYLDGEMPLGLMQERDKAYPEPSENLFLLNHEYLFDRTGLVFNIAEPVQQKEITAFCLKKGASVLFLDNLSSLASGVAESDADDWEKLQPWLLDLRRRHIAVVIVHHAGRSGLMRGTSRREDNVFWIIKLSEEDFEEPGCRFLMHFEKNRNAPRDPDDFIWTFRSLPSGLVEISWELCTLATQLVERLRNEPTSARQLMTEFKLSHSTIYRELNRLRDAGTLGKSGKIWRVL